MPNSPAKEKPKYSVWQNSVYVLRSAWKTAKSVPFGILGQIAAAIGASLTALFLPKTVIAQIESAVPLSTLVLTILAFTAVGVLFQAAGGYLLAFLTPRLLYLRILLCNDLTKKHMTTDYCNLDDPKFTDLHRKTADATNNNNCATEQIYRTFSSLGKNLLGFVIYLALLISVNPLILALTAATTAAGFFIRKKADRWAHEHDSEKAACDKKLGYLGEREASFGISKDIRMFAMGDWLKQLFNDAMQLSLDWNRKAESKQLWADAANCVMTFLREGIAYGYLIWMVTGNGLPASQFVLLFGAIGGFSGWIMGIFGDLSELNKHSLAYNRVREFLEFPDRYGCDGPEALPVELHPQTPYAIELRNVSFRYIGADKDTLTNINLKISAGEKIAVVGLNGAGKTTLIKLICGLYEPGEGTVLLNGVDIRRYNRRDYYRLFSAVFQDFNILPASIAETVAQLPADELEPDRVQACLRSADLEDKVASLPLGANTLLERSVNEDAVELSGGETQRLMLARALYKDAPILILDEPTAALDPIAESSLYQKYNVLSKSKTSLYISHRLASTHFCDRILLIDNGGIAEAGSHDELLAAGGKYAELFEVQSQYYRENVGGAV